MEKIKDYAKDSSTSLPRVIISNHKKNARKLAKQHKEVVLFVDSLAKNNLVKTGID